MRAFDAMPCKFRVTIPQGSIVLTAPGDWFEVHAKILAVMGIKDDNPVLSESQAATIADERMAAIARQGVGSSASGRNGRGVIDAVQRITSANNGTEQERHENNANGYKGGAA